MKPLLIFTAALLLCLPSPAAPPDAEDPSGGVPKPEVDLPFPVGEILVYEIYWGWVGVGRSIATTSWEWHENRWCIAIRFRTRTSGVAEQLYPVDDNVVTYVDGETLRPLRFITKLNAGGKVRDEETVFDWERGVARYTRRREGREDETKEYPIQEHTRDLVSFMYFMRSTAFQENSSYDFEVVVNDKLYELEANSKEHEEVRLKNHGKIRSLRIEPRASFEGVFVRKGEMVVWLSEDDRRILTKLEVDTPFASVKLLLRNVLGPGDDDWIKKGGEE